MLQSLKEFWKILEPVCRILDCACVGQEVNLFFYNFSAIAIMHPEPGTTSFEWNLVDNITELFAS